MGKRECYEVEYRNNIFHQQLLTYVIWNRTGTALPRPIDCNEMAFLFTLRPGQSVCPGLPFGLPYTARPYSLGSLSLGRVCRVPSPVNLPLQPIS